MAEDTNNKQVLSEEEIQKQVDKARENKVLAANFLSNPKQMKKMSLENLLITQEIVNGALKSKEQGDNSEITEKLTSPKAQKNLNYAVLGILEAVAAGASVGTEWGTFKANKDKILKLVDNSPEEFKQNFSNTIAMVNRRLRPTEKQKPKVRLYHGEMKKGFVNSVIYNNFYAADSWGKKNVIHPWRKFKRKINKLFEPPFTTKLARLQRRNNKIKRKLWIEQKKKQAKNWMKSLPGRLNKKRKELGGKFAKWFKEKTWVGKKLVQANKWCRETGRKIKNKAVEYGNKAWNMTKTVGHVIYVGAKYTALGATAPLWGPPYLVYQTGKKAYNGIKSGANWTKGQYGTVKTNIKEKMNNQISKANKDQEKYANRNPHPYEKLNEEQQKEVSKVLKQYSAKAHPTVEKVSENGEKVTQRDTKSWASSDIERQAASEMLDQLAQPKDKGGLELQQEQAKEIIDFFQKQGLMKSTYDDIAKNEEINKPIQEEQREPEPKVEIHDNKSKGGAEEQNTDQQMPIEQQVEKLQMETSQQAVVLSHLKLLKQMQKDESNKDILNTMTENYTQVFRDIGIPEEKIAQIKEMNPDLFPKKEKAQETEHSYKTSEMEKNTVNNDRGDDVDVYSGTARKEKIAEDTLISQLEPEQQAKYRQAKSEYFATVKRNPGNVKEEKKAATIFKNKLFGKHKEQDKDGNPVDKNVGIDKETANAFIETLGRTGAVTSFKPKKAKQQQQANEAPTNTDSRIIKPQRQLD